MDRNAVIEALQREGNLKHSFSAKGIASLAEYIDRSSPGRQHFNEKGRTLRKHGVHY